MMHGKHLVALSAVCAVSTAMTATAYGATSTMSMEKKAVDLMGIMSATDLQANVTRGEFARMLVRASEYRHVDTTVSNVSVYADVLYNSEYASAIRIAATKEWMTGFLGGYFRPEQGVSLRDAARSMLAVLGYTNSDFTGNINENRMAKFSELGLDTNIKKGYNDVLTKQDCVHLFYNLMKAKTKNGSTYGSKTFNLTFSSDGEINMASVMDDSMKGPKVLGNGDKLDDVIPFSLNKASMFLDGFSSDEETIDDHALIVYYHESTKTIFAYSDDGDTKGATSGELTSIYYDSTDPFKPVTIELDTDEQGNAEGGDVFKLTSSEMQYLFSIYGEFKVGDDIVVVWEKNGNGTNATYTAIDAVED